MRVLNPHCFLLRCTAVNSLRLSSPPLTDLASDLLHDASDTVKYTTLIRGFIEALPTHKRRTLWDLSATSMQTTHLAPTLTSHSIQMGSREPIARPHVIVVLCVGGGGD